MATTSVGCYANAHGNKYQNSESCLSFRIGGYEIEWFLRQNSRIVVQLGLCWSSDDWMKVVFLDESRINIGPGDGARTFVLRRKGEEYGKYCIQGKLKFPI